MHVTIRQFIFPVLRSSFVAGYLEGREKKSPLQIRGRFDPVFQSTMTHIRIGYNRDGNVPASLERLSERLNKKKSGDLESGVWSQKKELLVFDSRLLTLDSRFSDFLSRFVEGQFDCPDLLLHAMLDFGKNRLELLEPTEQLGE